MTKRWMAAALLVMLAPAAVEAQRAERPDGPRHGRHARMMEDGRGPIERLLEKRDSLGLTADQVSRLETIRDRTRASTQPLVDRLVELRREFPRPERAELGDMTDEQRQELRERMRTMHDRARPILQELREHHRGAMDEVRDVLTEEQRSTLREHLHRGGKHPKQRRERRGDRREAPPGLER